MPEKHEDNMERLVGRRMFVRRLLLPLFLLMSSHFIVSCHAFTWGKDDPEGRVKNAKVSYHHWNCTHVIVIA